MNETLFFIHILILLLATRIAVHFGRSALIALVVVESIVANLFLPKQITLFGLHLTPTDAYALAALVGINLIQEYYGKEAAKNLIKITLFFLLFFTIVSIIQVAYIPSPQDTFHPAFQSILGITPRIFLSSIFCFFITQRLDVEIFQRLRTKLGRTQSMSISLTISQAVDTVLFSLLALTGIVDSILSIIVVSYLIKMITLACMVPFTKLFPAKEKIEVNR